MVLSMVSSWAFWGGGYHPVAIAVVIFARKPVPTRSAFGRKLKGSERAHVFRFCPRKWVSHSMTCPDFRSLVRVLALLLVPARGPATLGSPGPEPPGFCFRGNERSRVHNRKTSPWFGVIGRTAPRGRARGRRTASRPSSSRLGAARSSGQASIPNGRGRRRATDRSVPARDRSPAANRANTA